VRAAALAFLLGTLLCHSLPDLPDPRWSLLLPLAALAAWRWPRVRWLAALLLGLLWASWRAGLILEISLPPRLEGRDLVVEGVVADFPEALERNAHRLLFEIETLQADGRAWPVLGRARLTWPHPIEPQPRPGERWRFTVRLKRPHGMMNPGGEFDYEAWLFQQGIRATGSIRKNSAEKLAEPPWHSLAAWRYRLWQHLQAALAGHPRQAAIAALTLGAQQDMETAEWEVLRRTGTIHLLVISGLHITLLAIPAAFIGGWLWRRFALLLWLPAPRFGAIIGMAAAVGYAAMAGFNVPVQRSLIMLAVTLFGVLWGRQTAASHTLALALVLVLLWDPLAGLAPGFWLSFGAVAVIFLGLHGRLRQPLQWLRIHWIVSLGLIPLLLAWYGQVPLLSPLANLVAVPWVNWLCLLPALPGALLAPLWPDAGQALLLTAAWMLEWLWQGLDWLSRLPWAVWKQPPPPVWAALPAGVGVMVLLLPRGFPGRWIVGAIWLLPAFLFARPQPAAGELWFTLLDVGQGLAAVLRTPNRVLVYDAGPRFSAGFNAGSSIIAPYLRSQGISRIDTLIISHSDTDHSGGAAGLLAEIPADQILSGQPLPTLASRPCLAGQQWQWDGVKFEVLYPPPGMIANNDNRYSCVLRAEIGTQAVLLTGDIEVRGEAALLHSRQNLRASILQVPHHGSRSSSSPALVAAVQPEYALVASGYRNRFGFPKANIVARYVRAGAWVFDTAQAGALSFILTADGVSWPRQARQQLRRYWHQE
jgi:competence protein ComEC